MIKIDLSKCTGCRSCEVACAFYHSGKVGPDSARIKVTHIFEAGIDGPVTCQQCEERYCLSCPEKALKLGKMGQIISSPSLCTVCGKCERRCPIGAIETHNNLVYVCDLCGGSPRCVEACTQEALEFAPDPIQAVSLANISKATKKMNPSEKRHFYTETNGKVLRRKWTGKNA